MADKEILNPVLTVEQNNYEAPLGAKSNEVYIVDKDNNILCTLTDFYNEWLLFKQTSKFFQYGNTEPSSTAVKLWYKTSDALEASDNAPRASRENAEDTTFPLSN